jgi:hypothetical protein
MIALLPVAASCAASQEAGLSEPVQHLRAGRRAGRLQPGDLAGGDPAVGCARDRIGETDDDQGRSSRYPCHRERAAQLRLTSLAWPVPRAWARAGVEHHLAGAIRPVPGVQHHVIDRSPRRGASGQHELAERLAAGLRLDRGLGERPGRRGDPAERPGAG